MLLMLFNSSEDLQFFCPLNGKFSEDDVSDNVKFSVDSIFSDGKFSFDSVYC